MAAARHAHRIRTHRGKGYQQARAANPHIQQKLFDFYNTQVHPKNLANQRLRFTGYLRGKQIKLGLGPYVNQLQWQDLSGQAWLAGSFTLRTVAERREHFRLTHGDVIRAEVFWDQAWRFLWDMRVWDPDHMLAAGNPSYSGQMFDDLWLLSLSKDDFHYTNLHCHEILLRIARRYKIPLGQVSAGTHKIKVFDDQGVSPLDAIIGAYQIERQHSGRRFVIKWRNGKLNLTPLRRNPLLYVMHKQLANATVHHVTPDGFATALTGRSSSIDPKSGKAHKHAFSASRQVPNYGYVHQQLDYSQNYKQPELVRAVKHELAKRQTIGHTVDFDHQGIALVAKGDAVKLVIPEEGYQGARSIVWVSDITHTVSPGSYMMSPTISAADPIGMPLAVLKSKNTRQRALKRHQRRRHAKRSKKGLPTPAEANAIRQILRGG